MGVSSAHDAGFGFGFFGVLLVLLGLLWPIFPWGKKKQRQPAPVMAGQQAPMGMQPGFPQQPGYPQQGGYPPQPGYPPQQPGPGDWGQPPRQ